MENENLAVPKVSIVVPSFNERPEVICESLRSVMSQTFSDFECIVVDESTDPVRAQACRDVCAEDSRFIYHRPTSRLGLAASLNEGLAMARGKWVARFDSDDVCMPDRLAVQMSYLRDHPAVDLLGGGLEIIDEAGLTLAFRDYPETHEEIERAIQFTTPLAHPTVIYRRELVLSVGGYDPTFRCAEDLDLWLRLLHRGARFANVKRTLVKYRQQNVKRPSFHWRFNLRARCKNFSSRLLFRRLAGVVAISAWTIIPSGVQESVFKTLIFRR